MSLKTLLMFEPPFLSDRTKDGKNLGIFETELESKKKYKILQV